MLRAAAKNHESVLVVVDPADYPALLAELERARRRQRRSPRAAGWPPRPSRTPRATTPWWPPTCRAPARATAAERFPATLPLVFDKVQDLRYGENPHQQAAFYREPAPPRRERRERAACCRARTCPSTTSPTPTPRSSACGSSQSRACVIVKHANPCGVAAGSHGAREAYERAYRTDPDSAFGGIIAFNRELDAATASAITRAPVRRGARGPGVHRRGRAGAGGQAERARARARRSRRARRAASSNSAASPADCWRRRAIAPTCRRGSSPWPTRRKPTERELADLLFRLARVQVREVERHRVRPRRAPPSASAPDR